MSIPKQVRVLIHELLETHFLSGERFKPELVIEQVLARFKAGLRKGSEAAGFWEHYGEKGVRSQVIAAVRNRHELQEDDGQLPFPDFPMVHSHYDVQGDDGWEIVPTDQLTLREGQSKVAELRKAIAAMTEHADQLELFLESRFGAAVE